MSTIILDVSANTHKNNRHYLRKMLDELKKVDTGKHEIVIKHQLFQKAGGNIPLNSIIFDLAYSHAKSLGYKTTSSVFDKESLDFLLQFDIPFVKIANNRSLDWLIGEVPRKIPVYVSASDKLPMNADIIMQCVSNYPASIEDYEKNKSIFEYHNAISDHTTDFELWHKYHPAIIEWHYGLLDSTGLDAGPFMRTPEMLKEVL